MAIADEYRHLSVTTDDYDVYGAGAETVANLPGSPEIDESGHLIIPPDDYYFPMSTIENSTMDKDPNNTGPTTDFWTNFPISIDVNGYIYYYNENTGINVRGPAGASNLKFEDLTPAQITQITGKDGQNGVNGQDGKDGKDGLNGLSAYELWLQDQGYDAASHPIEEFYAYIANYSNIFVKEGSGNGSLILNYRGENNTASGEGALATGNGTAASGQYSASFGLHTGATQKAQMVIGTYNDPSDASIFIVGNGQENARSNAFTVSRTGDAKASGNVYDGAGNKLSDKVDKVAGKGLSTNDFTNSYKNFLDNYSVDSILDSLSTNPVENKAVYNAILGIESNNLVVENSTNEDTDLVFVHPNVEHSGDAGNVKYSSGLTYNPYRFNLLNGAEADSYIHTLGYGENLAAAANNQTLFGKNNEENADDVFQIGIGSVETPRNGLALDKDGNLFTAGEISDGDNNILSNKQDILTFDDEPTQFSQNMVNSGDLYDYLIDHGINPAGGLNIPQLDALREEVAALREEVADLKVRVEACEGRQLITDDTTGVRYDIGVNNGEFYIIPIDGE